MTKADRLDHATISTALRAPRVAIVFPGGENWEFWARAAMYAACETWGGHGFVVVPESDGQIDPHVVQATVAYDPDYVVALDTTVAHFEELDPGLIDRQLGDLSADSSQSSTLRDELASTSIPIDELDKARRELANACSVYRMETSSGEDDEEHRWWERETYLRVPVQKGPLTAIEEFRGPMDPDAVPIAIRRDLIGPFGVAAIARLGLLSAPRASGSEPDEHEARSIVRWLLNLRDPWVTRPPTSIIDVSSVTPTADAPSAWAMSIQGLVPVSSTDRQANRGLVVLGDSANDFALSMIWDRMYGRGVWIPFSWWDEGESFLAATVLEQLESTISQTHRSSQTTWTVTSTSVDVTTAAKFHNAILNQPSGIFALGRELTMPANAMHLTGEAAPPSYKERGKFHYGIEGQFSSRTTLPVLRDSLGSTVLAATPAAPVVIGPRLRTIPNLSWQVDIDIPDTPIPPGRQIPTRDLLHPDEPTFGISLRSSRNGLSFEAQLHGLVLAGSAEEDQLARPRVRKPSLFSWAQVRARMMNREVVTSSAGMHAQLIQGLLGGRKRLIDEMCSDLRRVFAAYARKGSSTRSIFPNGGGCLIRKSIYLDIEGIASIGEYTPELAREKCDFLLSHRVLTRGLILNCGTCDDQSFFSIDRLRQANPCIRCGQVNELEQIRWKSPIHEPVWFYDLHPAATALMKQHGDVPLLLAGHLRSHAQDPHRYRDTHEIVLTEGQKTVAEVDLLSLVDGRLIVAEAKTTTALDAGGRQKEEAAKKKVLLASVFAADEIVLATTKSEWNDSSIQAMQKAIRDYGWHNQSPPRLRVTTKLGTSDVQDRYV